MIDLSPQQVVSCSKQNFGCSGGWVEKAFRYITSAGGLEYDAYYPYTSGTSGQSETCTGLNESPAVTVSSYTGVSGETTAVANYVSTTGPLTLYIDASSWNTYTGGIMTASSCPAVGSYINHAGKCTPVDDPRLVSNHY